MAVRRVTTLVLLALGALAVLVGWTAPAGAQAGEGESTSTTAAGAGPPVPAETTTTTRPEGAGSVRGTLLDKKGTTDFADDEPVEGVKITVEDDDGEEVGSGVTDARGRFEILLPGEGEYKAVVDEDTLPDDADLGTGSIDFFLRPGQDRILLFDVNAGERQRTGRFALLLQAVVDGVYFGLIVAICAVGLSLIYGTTGLTNFAHGELVTLGALLAFFFNRNVGLHLFAAAPLAVVAAAGIGWLLDSRFWGPLRRRGTGNAALMVVSIGLALAALNFYLYLFGGLTQPFSDFRGQEGMSFGAVSITSKKLVAGAICLIVLVGVATALQRTRTGKAMRAISDNPDLASSSGIDVDRVIRLVWFFGAGLAGLGGIMFSVTQDVNVEQGSSMLLLLFAAITLGGLGAAYGALVGGFVIGLFVTVSAVWIPTELKNVGALAVLIVVLLVRPQGILGQKERIG